MKLLLASTLFAVSCASGPQKPFRDPDAPQPAPVAVKRVDPPPRPAPVTPPEPVAPKPLFERLGGKEAIVAVVHEFVGRTTTDPRIKERFFNTDRANLEAMLVDLVCMATGGPCQYRGKDMTTAHAGMELVDEEFTALVENLVATLDQFKVPEQEKGELLAPLAAMKPEMVIPADQLKPLDATKLAEVTQFASTMQDKAAADLLAMAVVAGKRGQRNYAEQLFARVELALGAPKVAKLAPTFREGAPPMIATATKPAKDATPQPARVGSSDEDAPDKKPAAGRLKGTLQVDGKPVQGLGVIMLTPAAGGRARTPKVRIVEQREKQFFPHILAVPSGSTVQFPNFDPIYHNVFSLSKPKAFDLGMYKAGELKEVKFDKPGIVRLGCNIHSAMAAYVVVVDAPHYVVVDESGAFSFASLKPGKYTVRAWSERSGEPVVSQLVVKPGDNSQVIDLKASGALAGSGTDKFGAVRAAPAK